MFFAEKVVFWQCHLERICGCAPVSPRSPAAADIHQAGCDRVPVCRFILPFGSLHSVSEPAVCGTGVYFCNPADEQCRKSQSISGFHSIAGNALSVCLPAHPVAKTASHFSRCAPATEGGARKRKPDLRSADAQQTILRALVRQFSLCAGSRYWIDTDRLVADLVHILNY
jgi:hypothetical protein